MIERSRERHRASALSLGALVSFFVGCWCAPGVAWANGRFPRAQRLVEDPSDPNHLTLAATYGLVTTSDRGRTWQYICEQSFFGPDTYFGDPLLDTTGKGTMLVDVQSSLNVSRDRGCTWPSLFGGAGVYVNDFTIARQTNGILVLSSSSEDGSVVIRVSESTDDGKTFSVLGMPLPIGKAFTIDVAPSDPSRIYVSARSITNVPELALSTDHGTTWSVHDIACGPDEVPYIAAIDPTDPKKVFVRTDSTATDASTGATNANDALFVTPDAGQSWTEEFRQPARMFGFALSPDGSTVLLGYGDPKDSDIPVDTSVLGVYQSATSTFAFARLSTSSAWCLTWSKTGIYECTSPDDAGYALAMAEGSTFGADGGNLTPLLYLRDLQGPLSCCGSANACAADWSSTCLTFDACDAGASAAKESTCTDAGASEDAASSQLEAGALEAGSNLGEAGEAESAPPPKSGGCGCRVESRAARAEHGWLAALVALCAFAIRQSWRSRFRRPLSASRMFSARNHGPN